MSRGNNAWHDFCNSLCLAFCLNLQDSSLLGNTATLVNVVKLQSHWAADENGLDTRDWGSRWATFDAAETCRGREVQLLLHSDSC